MMIGVLEPFFKDMVRAYSNTLYEEYIEENKHPEIFEILFHTVALSTDERLWKCKACKHYNNLNCTIDNFAVRPDQEMCEYFDLDSEYLLDILRGG